MLTTELLQMHRIYLSASVFIHAKDGYNVQRRIKGACEVSDQPRNSSQAIFTLVDGENIALLHSTGPRDPFRDCNGGVRTF